MSNPVQLIMQRLENRNRKVNGAFDDINRSVITAIMAVDVYGSIAYEEDIVQLIIGRDESPEGIMETLKRNFQERVNLKEVKLNKKDGFFYNPEGLVVLHRV